MAIKVPLARDRVTAIGTMAAILTVVLAFVPSRLTDLGIRTEFATMFIGVSYVFALALFVAVFFASYSMKTDISEKARQRAVYIFETIYNKSLTVYGIFVLAMLPFGIGSSLAQFINPQTLGIFVALLVTVAAYYAIERRNGGKK